MFRFVVALCLTQTVLSVPAEVTEHHQLRAQPISVGSPITKVCPVYNATVERGVGRSTNYPITHHGGPVMAAPNAYIIWYGTWSASAKSLINNFVSKVGTTAWWAINKAYGVGPLVYKQAAVDNYSQGKSLTQDGVWAIVDRALSKGLLSKDTNGIYLVLSASDVTLPGFCSEFCGWHTYRPFNGGTYKYGWIGLPTSSCQCFIEPTSPNGDFAVDAAITTIAHELAEAATDPTGTGWCYSQSSSCFDSGTVENADQCAWNFVNAVYAGNYQYNLVVGSTRYLVQSNWNLASKRCSMS